MDIFISGAACRAVFSEGAESYFVNLDRPDEHIHFGSDQIPVAAISLLLGNSSDITESVGRNFRRWSQVVIVRLQQGHLIAVVSIDS